MFGQIILIVVVVFVLVVLIALRLNKTKPFDLSGISETMRKINDNLLFLQFKLEDHPELIAQLETGINKILEEEGIKKFDVSYEEHNANREGKEAVGSYVYTTNQTSYQSVLQTITELEADYGKSVVEIARDTGRELKESDYVLPRIMLCEERLMEWGLQSYYQTYLHEIGHHFAVLELGTDHEEKDADRHAMRVLHENFSPLFKGVFDIHYRVVIEAELSEADKEEAVADYKRYLKEIKNKN